MSDITAWQKCKRFVWRLTLIGLVFFIFLVIYLDSVVRDEFKQQAWSIPAKVYARPLAFALGQKLALNDLLRELRLLGYRQKIKAVNQGEFEQYDNTLVIHTRRFEFWDGVQPAQVLEVTIANSQVTQLKDFESGKKVDFLRLDPLSLGSIQAGNHEDRQLITLKQLPESFIAALLTVEDREFYQHWGLSIKGIARALWSNIAQGGIRQGGSTLTQQLMKNHFLTNERTLWRKMREAIMAVLTEVHYDKDVILEAYINEVYLGQAHASGIYGFARASEFYFDKPIHQLHLSQIALLVGLVKGPSYYNPRKNPQAAKQRRDLVLSLMHTQGLITDEAYNDAKSRALMVVEKAQERTSKVPAFMDFIKRELQQEYSLTQLHQAGLKLFTSLDPLIQAKAERALKQRLAALDSGQADLQGAVIVSDIKSGDILAMVGDKNPNYVGFNRALDAYRQTGSVIKPFVYLTALQRAEAFNLLSPLEDTSFTLKGSDESLWTPENYDKQEYGTIPLKDGLIHSLNIATARLALSVGVEQVVDTLYEAGFNRELPAYPSIALGAKEMSPLEVLRLYQVIANNGKGIKSGGLLAVQDHQSQLLQRYPRKVDAQLDADSVFILKYLLTQVVQEGTAKAIGQAFPRLKLAGKTGTTNDLRDSWYAGFGGTKLAVVWVGRDDNQSTKLTGASGALTVWRDLFQHLSESSVSLNLPEGMVWGFKDEGFFSNLGACKKKPLMPFYKDQVPEGIKICD
ncbi:penicillin-binding protein 1B [Aliikangiella sp. IMCC44632]